MREIITAATLSLATLTNPATAEDAKQMVTGQCHRTTGPHGHEPARPDAEDHRGWGYG